MGPAGPRVVVSPLRGDEYKVSVTGFSLPSQSLIAGYSPLYIIRIFPPTGIY